MLRNISLALLAWAGSAFTAQAQSDVVVSLYFDNASLRTILQQLGRVYDVNIVCRDEQLLNKHFHYMCNIKDSLENALKLLNESSEVNVKLQDNVIVIE